MKKSKIFFTLVLFLLIWSCSERSSDDIANPPPNNTAPTEIKGHLSGVLTRGDSPYIVMDTIFVDAQSNLTIEKGVTLVFTDSSSFIIRGKLTAVGEANSVISFTAFSSRWRGIKVINSSQNSTFRFCIFEKIERLESSQFGGMQIENSIAAIQNCIFRNNRSVQGGGLSLLGDASLIKNNIFRENYAVVFGGGILAFESTARIINNTIYNNRSYNVGGGLVLWNPVAMDIQNNIFFENTAQSGDPRIYLSTGDSLGFDQQYNFLPIGNQDPKFISDDDLHLQPGSPCIDAGNPDPDFDDVDGTTNDQGAYGGPLGNW